MRWFVVILLLLVVILVMWLFLRNTPEDPNAESESPSDEVAWADAGDETSDAEPGPPAD